MQSNLTKTRKITYFAVLSALVVVFQLLCGTLRIGAINLNLSLVPIVVGAMLLGAISGALIGVIEGVVVLVMGITGLDPFTNTLFGLQHAVITAVCIIKTAAAGAVSGLLFKFCGRKNRTLGAFAASAAAPVVNTLIFVIGMLFIPDTLIGLGYTDGSFAAILTALVGFNFFVELFINLVLAPAALRVVDAIDKNFGGEQ